MKSKIILGLSLFCFGLSHAQKTITWKDLAKITYTEKYFEEYDETFLYPDFSKEMIALQGKLVSIKGYFLNVDPEAKLYILSKGPMASCFFCGEGGPETAVELQFSSKQKFKTDAIVMITGRLQLNKDDVEHFNYILKECKGSLLD